MFKYLNEQDIWKLSSSIPQGPLGEGRGTWLKLQVLNRKMYSAGEVWFGCQGYRQASITQSPWGQDNRVGLPCWACLPVGPKAFACYSQDDSVTSSGFSGDDGTLDAISSYTGKLCKWDPGPRFCPGTSFFFSTNWLGMGDVLRDTREQVLGQSVLWGTSKLMLSWGWAPCVLVSQQEEDLPQINSRWLIIWWT